MPLTHHLFLELVAGYRSAARPTAIFVLLWLSNYGYGYVYFYWSGVSLVQELTLCIWKCVCEMFPIKGLSKNHRVKVEGGVLCHAAAIEVTKNIAYSSTFAIKQSQIQYQNHFQVIQILLFLYIRKVQKGRTISNHQSYGYVWSLYVSSTAIYLKAVFLT